MRREPSKEVLEFFASLAEQLGIPPGTPFHINMPIICDRCLDDNKEAFPYNEGGFHHLCNECWDEVAEKVEPVPGEFSAESFWLLRMKK